MTFSTFTGQYIDLYPTQGQDSAIEIVYSAIPKGDIADTILDLPDEARDAIVNLALSNLLVIPGKYMNPQLSMTYRMQYENLRTGLRSLAVLGMGGTASFRAPLFGGLGNRFWPYFFVPTTLPGPNGG